MTLPTRMTPRSLTAAALLLLAPACKDDPPAPASEVVELPGPEDGKAGKAGEPKNAAGDEAAADLPAAEDLLAKAVQAMGGAEKISGVHSFHQEGTVQVKAQNLGGKVRMWWKDGDFYMESEMPGVGLIRGGRQGEVVWTEDPIMGLRRLSGPELDQARWQATLSLAASWREFFDRAQTVGKREVGGKAAYDVKLQPKQGKSVTLTLDAETGLPVAQAMHQVSPMGETPVKVTLSDYREVDGIKVPFAQEMDMGLATMEQVTTKLELNVPVDESKFAMPTKGATRMALPLPGAPGAGPAGPLAPGGTQPAPAPRGAPPTGQAPQPGH